MNETIIDIRKVSSANAWWSALPDITKVSVYEDLMEILVGEHTAG